MFYLPPAMLQQPCLLVAGSGGIFTCISALVFMFGARFSVTDPPRKHLLITRFWWAGGLLFLGPTGLWQLERWFLWGCYSQDTAQTELRRLLQPCCEKGFFASLRASAWGANFRFGTHFVAYRAALKECRLLSPSWHSPSVLLQLTGVTKKRVTLIWSPDFCGCGPGDNSRSPNSGGQCGSLLQFHRTVCTCVF